MSLRSKEKKEIRKVKVIVKSQNAPHSSSHYFGIWLSTNYNFMYFCLLIGWGELELSIIKLCPQYSVHSESPLISSPSPGAKCVSQHGLEWGQHISAFYLIFSRKLLSSFGRLLESLFMFLSGIRVDAPLENCWPGAQDTGLGQSCHCLSATLNPPSNNWELTCLIEVLFCVIWINRYPGGDSGHVYFEKQLPLNVPTEKPIGDSVRHLRLTRR